MHCINAAAVSVWPELLPSANILFWESCRPYSLQHLAAYSGVFSDRQSWNQLMSSLLMIAVVTSIGGSRLEVNRACHLRSRIQTLSRYCPIVAMQTVPLLTSRTSVVAQLTIPPISKWAIPFQRDHHRFPRLFRPTPFQQYPPH